ncbi:translation initiation factor IF-2 [bacterium]|nr:translation initiation factor IF-2 [bacterium]|tara:strand:+ start:8120 stop:9628 length:1509 start_codon:yes stop_codon:yes gene_type:complete
MAEKREQKERPPIVAIMGHIDHGKSTLLDYIRESNVVEGEAGGITQHVNAYEITHKNKEGERRITFIDTPGHEAFTGSRKTGARIADIALLIVSAEEGVKEQTKESLKMITEAKAPYIVVINKIDKPNANPDKAKQDLAEIDVFVEGYGGHIPCALVSSKTGEGIDDLLDVILLSADLEELKGTPDVPATGFVLESHVDKKVGVTGTLIIKDGTLKTGMFLCIDGIVSKIKRLEDFTGKQIKEASFSSPIRIAGLSEVPPADTPFESFENKKDAEEHAKVFAQEKHRAPDKEVNGDEDARLMIPLVIKADVLGTLEAIEKEVNKLDIPEDRAYIKILAKGIGDVSENDLKVAASAQDPIVIGFNVKVDKAAKDFADNAGITPQLFSIIYKINEYLQPEITNRIPKIKVEEVAGSAKIIKLFSQVKNKQLVGMKVNDGTIALAKPIRVIRNDAEVGRARAHEMQIQNIKITEGNKGDQIGAQVESKLTLALGDVLEFVDEVEK